MENLEKLTNYIETKKQNYEEVEKRIKNIADQIEANIRKIEIYRKHPIKAIATHNIVNICKYITELNTTLISLIDENVKAENEIDELKEILGK